MKKCLLILLFLSLIPVTDLLCADDSQPRGNNLESSSHVLLGKMFKTFNKDEWAESEFQTAVKLSDNKEAYRELATIYSERAAKGNQAPSVKQMYQKQAQEMALKAEGKRDAAKERAKLTQSRIEPYQVQRDMFGRDVEQWKRERAREEVEKESEHEAWLKKYNAQSKRLRKTRPSSSIQEPGPTRYFFESGGREVEISESQGVALDRAKTRDEEMSVLTQAQRDALNQ